VQDTVWTRRYDGSTFCISQSFDAGGFHSFKNLIPRHLMSLPKFVSPGTLLVLCTLFRRRRSRSFSNTSSMAVLDQTTRQEKIFTSGPPSRGSVDTGASQLSRSLPFGRRCRWATSPLLWLGSSARGAPYLIYMSRAIGC